MEKDIEIHKVKNGYVAHPPFDPARLPPVRFDDMHVFETFDGLVAWLREQFEGKQGLTPGAADTATPREVREILEATGTANGALLDDTPCR